MSASTQNYGAVAKQEEDVEQSYDIDNTYYVKERTLTAKERLQKIMLLGLPILAAFLIIGGFAFYLIRDAHILSPEPGGGGINNPALPPRSSSGGPHVAPKPAPGPVPAPVPGPAPKKSSHASGSSSCAANSRCHELGLVGECCPTDQGVTLGCCD